MTGPLSGETPIVPGAVGQPPVVPAAGSVAFVPTQRAPHAAELPRRGGRPGRPAPTAARDDDTSRWPAEAVRALASHAVVESTRPITAPTPVVGDPLLAGPGELVVSTGPIAVVRTPPAPERAPVLRMAAAALAPAPPAASAPAPCAARPATERPAPAGAATTGPADSAAATAPDAQAATPVSEPATAPEVDALADVSPAIAAPAAFPSRRSLRTAPPLRSRVSAVAVPGLAVAGAFAAGYCGHLLLG